MPRNYHGKYFLTVLFVSLLFTTISISQVFAMGDAPSTCTNRYDGTITSFVIDNGSNTFDPIANPGVTFNVNTSDNYTVTFTIHTSDTSSQNNTNPGTTWYHDDVFAFADGHCVPDSTTASINPDQNVIINRTLTNPHPGYYFQSVFFSTFSTLSNPVTYNVQWIASSSVPQNLQAMAVSSSEIHLSWTAPANNDGSEITGYQIERSGDAGSTWSTIVENTGSTSTTYSDTGLQQNTTYTYRVSAINGIGTSSPSDTASATTSTDTGGIVLNNVQSTSGSTSSPTNQIMLSDFDAGTGKNRLLVVGVSADTSDVASITFGGMPLTKKVGSFYNNDAEFWYLKNPIGNGAIVVTMNGPTSTVVGAYSFSGVNQTNSMPTKVIRHNTNPNSPTISITTKFPDDWVLDLPSIYGGSTLNSSTCVQQWNSNIPDTITGASSYKIVPTPRAVTCKWTASTADFWDDVAIEIRASK